jgi:hypothetical protein
MQMEKADKESITEIGRRIRNSFMNVIKKKINRTNRN